VDYTSLEFENDDALDRKKFVENIMKVEPCKT
jgi:hypothetical protein